ncbi:MAG: NADH-quinone oxidoreductase subunit I, partial [Candidatus Acidiferrales bacterium]
MPSILKEIGETAVTLAKGLSVTFRWMFRPTVTENYPEEPVQFESRYRGIHVLHRDENGLE